MKKEGDMRLSIPFPFFKILFAKENLIFSYIELYEVIILQNDSCSNNFGVALSQVTTRRGFLLLFIDNYNIVFRFGTKLI